MWDKHELALHVRRQELLNQHDEKPFITPPFDIDVTFYFMTPCNNPTLDGKPYVDKPPLHKLIQFIHGIAEDILYASGTPITTISCKKVYDYDPRTEITIIKGRNGKKK